MSPYLYHRLMREQRARLRQHAGAASGHDAQEGVALRAQPGPCRRTALRAAEMSAVVTTATTYRQLDQRSADGLEVTLEWNPATDALRIVLVDRESEAVTFRVSALDAPDAFVHPFIYAGRAVCLETGSSCRPGPPARR
jgi:hypothetical protein